MFIQPIWLSKSRPFHAADPADVALGFWAAEKPVEIHHKPITGWWLNQPHLKHMLHILIKMGIISPHRAPKIPEMFETTT